MHRRHHGAESCEQQDHPPVAQQGVHVGGQPSGEHTEKHEGRQRAFKAGQQLQHDGAALVHQLSRHAHAPLQKQHGHTHHRAHEHQLQHIAVDKGRQGVGGDDPRQEPAENGEAPLPLRGKAEREKRGAQHTGAQDDHQHTEQKADACIASHPMEGAGTAHAEHAADDCQQHHGRDHGGEESRAQCQQRLRHIVLHHIHGGRQQPQQHGDAAASAMAVSTWRTRWLSRASTEI